MTYPLINKESIVNDSIKKYFVENLVNVEGLYVVFDRTMSPPTETDVDKWVFVDIQDTVPGQVTRKMVMVYCFTRDDLEGVQLATLIDTVMKYLYDNHLIFYAEDNETIVGGSLLTVDELSRVATTKDNTKLRYISVLLTWGGTW